MKEADYIDDQLLGAFVDGEVDAANREAILRTMETDADLRERVYRLRRASDLMQLGFGEAMPPSSRVKPQRRWQLFSARLAASVAALAISFGAGMLGQQYLGNPTEDPTVQHAGASREQVDGIILHVSQSDRRQFEGALNYTEQFLKEHARSGTKIEVVAHAGGLDLLRDDVSPLKDKIITLMQEYENVHFIACANAIRLLKAKGTVPHIIKGVSTDSTAFDHIVSRLQGGGWQYIKVESLPGI